MYTIKEEVRYYFKSNLSNTIIVSLCTHMLWWYNLEACNILVVVGMHTNVIFTATYPNNYL